MCKKTTSLSGQILVRAFSMDLAGFTLKIKNSNDFFPSKSIYPAALKSEGVPYTYIEIFSRNLDKRIV